MADRRVVVGGSYLVGYRSLLCSASSQAVSRILLQKTPFVGAGQLVEDGALDSPRGIRLPAPYQLRASACFVLHRWGKLHVERAHILRAGG